MLKAIKAHGRYWTIVAWDETQKRWKCWLDSYESGEAYGKTPKAAMERTYLMGKRPSALFLLKRDASEHIKVIE